VRRASYFPILDVLRWAASSAVVLAHSTVFFPPSAGQINFGAGVRNAGYYAVLFFYTLSGFLISYLLLLEKENTGGVALGSFYKRRALRIWPLYYLIVLLSFFVFPHVLPLAEARGPGWGRALLLYLFFLPNVAGLKGFYLATCFHTYTIGFEEQFYLLWPLVLRKARKLLPLLLVGLFVGVGLLEAAHLWIIAHGLPLPDGWVRVIRAVLTFVNASQLPAFVAGAAGAWLYLRRGPLLGWLMGNRVVRIVVLAVLALLMQFGQPNALGYVNLVSIVFVLLILSLLESPVGRVGKLLAKGGRISYGIYIYHPVVLLALSMGMERLRLTVPGRPLVSWLLYLGIAYGLVLGLSSLSYRYYERFFLRKKPVAG
jgi:peptidoglycan/LPS O-acetylase OafA/YrhL